MAATTRENLINLVLALAEDEDDEMEDECIRGPSEYFLQPLLTVDTSVNLFPLQPLFRADTSASVNLALLSGCLQMEREEKQKKEVLDEYLRDKDEEDFFRHMRVSKETFRYILDIFSKHYHPVYSGGSLPTVGHVALSIGLCYLGNKCTYRGLAKQFNVSESCAYACVKAVVDSMNTVANDYVKWPDGDDAVKVEDEFRQLADFPGVLGVVDSCHIQCKVPEKEQAAYLNRHSKHSIHLMAICKPSMAFSFICAGYIGSAQDSTVLKYTSIYGQLEADSSPLFPSANYHLIGGSTFPLKKHLLVPFENTGDLTNQQQIYNNKLLATRSIINSAFGFLKGRFGRLKLIDTHISRTCQIVQACCVLHNIILQFPHETELLLKEGSVQLPQDDLQEVMADDASTTNGLEKRNNIAIKL